MEITHVGEGQDRYNDWFGQRRKRSRGARCFGRWRNKHWSSSTSNRNVTRATTVDNIERAGLGACNRMPIVRMHFLDRVTAVLYILSVQRMLQTV
jgi:hypothetical protein